ncbi:hypothetical protein O9992_25455 [Vibrio lentus]|nr:hypothetical protein [Vibrio lentus]
MAENGWQWMMKSLAAKRYGCQNIVYKFYDCINIAIMGIELRNMGDSAGMTQMHGKYYKRMTSYLKQVFAQVVTDESDFFSLFHAPRIKHFAAQLKKLLPQQKRPSKN